MNDTLRSKVFLDHYFNFKNRDISGRYLNLDQLEPELEKYKDTFFREKLGVSESGFPIYSLKIGKGPIKILAWSQMHGNESTTTKAILDLLNLFSGNNKELRIADMLNKCSLIIIPMLNPDGALGYTRENRNRIDLNRDARTQTQKETNILIGIYNTFSPDFCFNLHDQRTIFSAGPNPNPASISFLAPAFDDARSLSPNRTLAMKIIASVNQALQPYLKGQIGRFDDSFNMNCTGDYFQAQGTPTILFEAGHIPGDYQREESRKYMALAIYEAMHTICYTSYNTFEKEDYQIIPQNEKKFFDILLRNAILNAEPVDIAIQYVEKFSDGTIVFEPVVQHIGPLVNFYGHRTVDCERSRLRLKSGNAPVENDIVPTILLNKTEISFKIE